MTRPEIIRADSLDLQDHDTPSAKDHKNAPGKSPLSNGSLAPHQAETLRGVAAETAEENLRSPRVSWSNGDADLQQYAEDLAGGVGDSLNGQKMQQEDALAIAQNGGTIRQDEIDGDGTEDEDLDDDMMDKISSSPSIEDEDIDFEFVYALHTFVATVEGQANATKGDTMVLLDDSNSYWWLVRVVKDSSIGYLPAEHIETPTERLARLNKHRNIDLSASMLGDQAEKTKNPIKSAMRRRKAKTVQFAPPTFVDYSDFDDSSDEEEVEGDAAQQQGQQQGQQQAPAEEEVEDETAKVEPLKPRTQQKQVKIESPKQDEVEENLEIDEKQRNSDEIFETKSEGQSRSRNGTVRNTDSFFKDETVETKKITLTPNLLRDDNDPRFSSDSKEIRQRPSLDKLEKDSISDKSKDDKKKKEKDKKDKEKKPSAIRSFFSRKDKKKSVDDDDESFGKRSMDVGAEPAERETDDAGSPDVDTSQDRAATPQRHPSKLQKQQPRTEPSPTRKSSISTGQNGMDLATFLSSEQRTNNVANVPPASMRMVEPEPDDLSQKEQKSKAGGITGRLRSNSEAKPQKVVKAKSRVELDDFDTSDEEEIAPEPTRVAPPEPVRQAPEAKLQRPVLPGSYPDSYMSTQTATSQQTERGAQNPQEEHQQRLPSPRQGSPVNSANPPALMVDTSSQEDRSSPISSPSPELGETEEGGSHRNQDSMTSTSGTTGPTWNDANLRAFFDSSSDIRDMFVVVHDTTDVAPAGPEHPVTGPLFREQNAKLAEITTQLDNMLGDWLARKQRLRGTL